MQPIVYTLTPLSPADSDTITRALRRGVCLKLTMTQNYLLVKLQSLMDEGYTSVTREEMSLAWHVCTKTIAHVLPTLAPYVHLDGGTLTFAISAFKEAGEESPASEPMCSIDITRTYRLSEGPERTPQVSAPLGVTTTQRPTRTGKLQVVQPGKTQRERDSRCPTHDAMPRVDDHRECGSFPPDSRNTLYREPASQWTPIHREPRSRYPECRSRSLAHTGAYASAPVRALGHSASLSRVYAHAVEDLLSSEREPFGMKREDLLGCEQSKTAKEGEISPLLQSPEEDTTQGSSSSARAGAQGTSRPTTHRESGSGYRESAGGLAYETVEDVFTASREDLVTALGTVAYAPQLQSYGGVHWRDAWLPYVVDTCLEGGQALPQQVLHTVEKVFRVVEQRRQAGKIQTTPATYFIASLRSGLGLPRYTG